MINNIQVYANIYAVGKEIHLDINHSPIYFSGLVSGLGSVGISIPETSLASLLYQSY